MTVIKHITRTLVYSGETIVQLVVSERFMNEYGNCAIKLLPLLIYFLLLLLSHCAKNENVRACLNYMVKIPFNMIYQI